MFLQKIQLLFSDSVSAVVFYKAKSPAFSLRRATTEMTFQDRPKMEESFRVPNESEFHETESWLLHHSMKKYLYWLWL